MPLSSIINVASAIEFEVFYSLWITCLLAIVHEMELGRDKYAKNVLLSPKQEMNT